MDNPTDTIARTVAAWGAVVLGGIIAIVALVLWG